MALGAGGAHARVGADYQDNPEINRLTGQPKATQVAPSDDKAKTPAISQYTPGVEHPAAYTIAYQGKEYKFAGRDADAPPDGKVITVGAGAIGIRGLKPVKVVLGDDGKYYVGNNTNEGYYNNYDSNRTGFKKPRPDVSGEGEPPGMFMVVVNGRDWKEFTSNKAFSVAKTIASKNPDKKVQVRWPNGALNSVAEAVAEVSPPGWEKTVKAMKKHKEIDNPWALAWSMKNKGYKSHKKESIDPYFKSLISKLEEKAKK